MSYQGKGASGDYLNGDGTYNDPTASNMGTVESVGLVLPAEFDVTVSVVTSTGDLTASWVAQVKNTFLAGPASGSNAAPTFRAIVAADLSSSGVADAERFLRGDLTWARTPLIYPIGFLQNNPTDAQTVYVGNMPRAPVPTANISKIKIHRSGTVKRVRLYTYANSVVGSNESWSVYFRLNNTTDTLIATIGAATAGREFENTGLSIAVSAGDTFEIKMVNPTWATNPTAVTGHGEVFIE